MKTSTSAMRFKDLLGLERPLKFLILSSFLIPFASFMVLPFMSIYLNQRLGVDIRQVGLILAVSSFIQFSGGIVGGFVANRFGLRTTMNLGLTIRTIGFGLLIFSGASYLYAVAALIIIACGAALYLPANKAYIVNGVSESNRALLLSLSTSALNLGMATGPLVAGVLITFSMSWVFSITALLFVILTVLHFAILPVGEDNTNEQLDKPSLRGSGAPEFNAYLALLLLINVLTLYVYMFFQNYMGVFTAEQHSAAMYSLVLVLNTVTIVIMMPALSERIQRLSYTVAIALGFAAFASGMCLISTGELYSIFAGTALISVGEVVLFLKNDLELVKYFSSTPEIAFGYQRLAAGVGALLSGAIGGFLYNEAQQGTGAGLFWVMVAIQCTLPLLLLPLLFSQKIRTRASSGAGAEPASNVEASKQPK